MHQNEPIGARGARAQLSGTDPRIHFNQQLSSGFITLQDETALTREMIEQRAVVRKQWDCTLNALDQLSHCDFAGGGVRRLSIATMWICSKWIPTTNQSWQRIFGTEGLGSPHVACH